MVSVVEDGESSVAEDVDDKLRQPQSNGENKDDDDDDDDGVDGTTSSLSPSELLQAHIREELGLDEETFLWLRKAANEVVVAAAAEEEGKQIQQQQRVGEEGVGGSISVVSVPSLSIHSGGGLVARRKGGQSSSSSISDTNSNSVGRASHYPAASKSDGSSSFSRGGLSAIRPYFPGPDVFPYDIATNFIDPNYDNNDYDSLSSASLDDTLLGLLDEELQLEETNDSTFSPLDDTLLPLELNQEQQLERVRHPSTLPTRNDNHVDNKSRNVVGTSRHQHHYEAEAEKQEEEGSTSKEPLQQHDDQRSVRRPGVPGKGDQINPRLRNLHHHHHHDWWRRRAATKPNDAPPDSVVFDLVIAKKLLLGMIAFRSL